MSAAFTPGPWVADSAPQHAAAYWYILAGSDVDGTPIVATVRLDTTDGPPRSEAEANARLIAAAPDLLQACEDALRVFVSEGHGHYREAETLRAAIAKATGGTE